jgi:restriction endonuclease S subunit
MEQKFIIISDQNSGTRIILNSDFIIGIALKLEVGSGKEQAAITLSDQKTYTIDVPHSKIIKILKPIDPTDDNVSQPIGYIRR